MKEKIMAVPTNLLLENLGIKNKNFIKVEFSKFSKVLEYAEFFPRNEIENNKNYKQIIPYVVFKNKEKKILVLKRTEKQGEKRLHNKVSIGIGGHINENDKGFSLEQTFFKGMEREVNEELWITPPTKYVYLGIINDDSEDVSTVHLGVLFVGHVESAEIKEVENFESIWLTKEELNNLKGVDYEGWTKIALENI